MGRHSAVLRYESFYSLGKNPFIPRICFGNRHYFICKISSRLILQHDKFSLNMLGSYKVRPCLRNWYYTNIGIAGDDFRKYYHAVKNILTLTAFKYVLENVLILFGVADCDAFSHIINIHP